MPTIEEIWAGSPTLTVGQSYNFTQFGEFDYFTFEAVAGVTYRIQLEGYATGKGTLDRAGLGVYDPNLHTTDTGYGVGLNGNLLYTAEETETIYLRQNLDPIDNIGDTYVLTVSTYGGDDFGDDASSATTISANGATSGELEVLGDTDWFAVNMTAGYSYTIALNGWSTGAGTLLDPYLRLYSSSSSSNPVQTDDDDGSGNNALITYTPTVSGVYYIEAMSGGLPTDFASHYAGIITLGTNRLNTDPGTYSMTVTESRSSTGSNGVTITDVDLGVFRFFNTATGTHFYSPDFTEAVSINENLPDFAYENVAFKSVNNSDANAIAFYRFFNTQTGTHFFTSNEAEKDSVIANMPQFNYEGVAYYLHSTADSDDIALYRFFNSETGTHFYTANEAEKDNVINTLSNMNYEGIVGYVDIT
ncbi:pre-peptidase C-terminal domain-containing protein [Roseibium sp.]|uniref:pre-peptidase C-terminal domain-containing protein n=1 Tax=Roseibium sp. TaxID=1936156 RepID=UPI003B51C96B